MAESRTQPTNVEPWSFVASVEHPGRRADAETLLAVMGDVTGWEPRMWGPSIVGFGRYRYRLANGKDAESLATGFSPRKANMVLYVVAGYDDLGDELTALGRHRVGKSCLYVNRLSDIDLDVLRRIIIRGIDQLRTRHEVTAG